MKNLLIKEIQLTSMPITFIFLLFAFMTLIPGYPILMGAFFICLGIFFSFQNGKETNDILYTVLLPIRKSDVVTAKYLFTIFIQLIAFVLMLALTVFRMSLWNSTGVYVQNAMMNATPIYLALVLLIFAGFSVIFLGGFFKTAYGIGKPFLLFSIYTIVLVSFGETLHHLPGLAFVNSGSEYIGIQWLCCLIALLLLIFFTLMSYRKAQQKFEQIDL